METFGPNSIGEGLKAAKTQSIIHSIPQQAIFSLWIIDYWPKRVNSALEIPTSVWRENENTSRQTENNGKKQFSLCNTTGRRCVNIVEERMLSVQSTAKDYWGPAKSRTKLAPTLSHCPHSCRWKMRNPLYKWP